ncbi:putative uvrD-like helicase C-terminal domain [Lyophyllum shimeji]|uniref:UvrD-like helicase C-terminal domain n=1 Tax=Lyophyllum shimeji TaxID=47721 RepID=A0A9P3PJW4_LYOSH|nr:putative uvrD-like helicase C-terminal domain [Lyophyllum shimeji]
MGPPMLPRKPVCRADLFEPSSFTHPEDIKSALAELESLITRENFTPVLEDLFDQPLVLELILSGLPHTSALVSWILESFPSTCSAYCASIVSKLLPRISVFFMFQPLPLIDSRTASDYVSRYHRKVDITPKLLALLSSMTFEEESKDIDVDEDDISYFVKVKPNQSQRKRLKRTNGRPTLSRILQDLELLENYGLPYPCNRQEADILISKVLADAKANLEFYFATLRLPEVTIAIQKAFIPPKDTTAPSKLETEGPLAQTDEQEVVQVPSAYPAVQPMKSALHFNSAEGFGEWRVLISTRADGDLREARRKDRKTFAIIVKKIKELSNGHFSDDNQKRLSGPNTDVPIFEAKMTRDLRLVYQVDSISDYESNGERQALRVFGIYTHAQMDNRLWDSIGRQLGKKGKEYRRRCMHRERPVHSGDNVFMPASFPPLEAEAPTNPVAIDLPPDDLEQIHALLVLEKYLTFSQELLRSILADLDVAFPFQVSAQEKEIIEHPYSCYVLGRSGTGKTTTMLFKMLWIERTYQLNSNDVAKPRQIFVTKSRVLAGKVEEYFLKLLESLKTASQSPEELRKVIQARKAQAEEDNLVDIDDEDNWRSDLPVKFSELQDSHFPLFITFDRLCELIEADFELEDGISNTKGNKKRRTFVSYDHFLQQYWPHFPQPLTKGLDPALIFSEIIGVIKGSEETLASRGYLERSRYEELSERTQSTFATQRNIVYSIFEAYQAQKRQRGEIDAADRTHGILRGLAQHGVIGQKIDQLCVDEAQDNLLIDALLLRSLSRNADGLFWAGDTAQTISVGSSFRFDDLKAFLFRIEKQRAQNQSHPKGSHQVQNPKTFQLAVNYRSHAGIVNCAHTVIELITRFWPYSIDTLAPEKGIVDGLKPVFLNGWNDDNVRYEQFLFGASGSHIEFGAQQCILVRDEVARDKLQEQVGDIGLIMTLYESKGLEFNDVLLFNFFEDSTVELSQWRLLLNVLDDNSINGVAAPRFDETRHAGICAELKFLYVAITRARKNLWIADHSDKGEPMRMVWTARHQIHNCTPGADMPRLAVSSSAEEWASKGKELFERKKFLQAKHCYERALMPREMAIANAYSLRDQARKTPQGDSRRVRDQRQTAFVTAAEAFLGCAEAATKNRLVYFRIAAKCFESGAEELRAANTYLRAHEYDTAAKLFRKLGLFDEAVAVIKTNEKHMQSDVVESIKDVARLYYFREKELKKARELFSSDEDELEYLEDLDLDIARAEVLTSLERLGEAAELHLLEGRTLDAIPLFLKDNCNISSMRQASRCILQELWRNLPFGVVPAQTQAITQLLGWAALLNMESLEAKDRDEIAMFKAILVNEIAELAKLAKSFLETNNPSAATLCLHHVFTRFPQVSNMATQDLAETLHLFHVHIRRLHDLAFQVEPHLEPRLAILFGVHRISGDEFLVPAGTFLYNAFQSARQSSAEGTGSGITINGWELYQTFTRATRDHLWQLISQRVEPLRQAPQFSSCLTWVALGYCNRERCRSEHTQPSTLTVEWYNARVRLNLQRALILQIFYTIDASRGTRQSAQIAHHKRGCLGQFYEALQPPLHYLGTHALLNAGLIPEFQKGIYVMKCWLHDLVETLDFQLPQNQFLTYLIRSTHLALTFNRNEFPKYLYRSPHLYLPKPSNYQRGSDKRYVLLELISSMEGNGEFSISSGILALKHILESKLQVNVSVICDLVEHLCSSLAVSDVLNRRGTLHGITLPRSWLLRHVRPEEMARAKGKATNKAPVLVTLLENLLETIYSGLGAEYLLFETSDIAKIPGVRPFFIARICRALCILGYNITSKPLRFNILRTIKSLRRGDRKFPSLYKSYILAEGWDSLVRALRSHPQGSLADDLIQLHDLGREPAPKRVPPGVRLVAFKANDDLPKLLGATSWTDIAVALEEPEPGHQLDEAVPATDGVPDDERLPDADVDDAEDGLVAEETDGVEIVDTEDGEAEAEALPIISDIPQAQPPTAAEIHAASIIQKAYRRALLRRRQMAKTGLSALRSRKFAASFEKARTMVWKDKSSYRLLFLGPLPHILLCLDIAYAATMNQKKSVKKRWTSASHETLDGLSSHLTQLNKISKSILRLQKELEVTSDIHSHCDVGKLQRGVQEAADLLRNLPFTPAQDFRKDLDIAYKGIVARRRPPKAPPKPDLVCEEDI